MGNTQSIGIHPLLHKEIKDHIKSEKVSFNSVKAFAEHHLRNALKKEKETMK